MQVQGFAATPYAALSPWPGGTGSPNAGAAALKTAGSADRGLLVSASFAQDMLRRLTDQAQAAGPNQAKDQAKDPAGLADALKGAVDYLRENFGSEAATASIGLVYQHAGNKPLSEENLGQGLVAALKFVDRNFGSAAGDRVLDFFNGDLNDQLNAYFENGQNERFLAVAPGMSGAVQAVQAALSQLGLRFGQEAADGLAKVIDQAVGDTLDPASLRGALTEARQWLDEHYGPAAAAEASQLFGQALAGPAPAAKGLLLDIAA